jgi:CBS domain-containing protein
MSDRSKEFLARAAAEPVKLTVRELLDIWGVRARTWESVGRIKDDLAAAGLYCDPDLGDGGAYTLVRVGVPAGRDSNTGSAAELAGHDEQDEPLELPSATLLVRGVPSATCGLISVHPNQTLAEAQALMTAHDYSQLAVMVGLRDLKGAVSWRSIAQAQLAKSAISLADATTRFPPVVHADEELLSQIDVIYRADFVFVRGDDDRVCGIVTTADLTAQFRDLTTPFFQLGEIEGRLRHCIDRVFESDELSAVTGRSRVKSARDMEFGQYIRLLDNDARWQRMNWKVNRAMFIGFLDAARVARNKVMHFGDELTAGQKQTLVQCLNFMRALDPLP